MINLDFEALGLLSSLSGLWSGYWIGRSDESSEVTFPGFGLRIQWSGVRMQSRGKRRIWTSWTPSAGYGTKISEEWIKRMKLIVQKREFLISHPLNLRIANTDQNFHTTASFRMDKLSLISKGIIENLQFLPFSTQILCCWKNREAELFDLSFDLL